MISVKRISKLLSVILLSIMLFIGIYSNSYAANSYYINGVWVSYNDTTSASNGCWNYANWFYKKIWGNDKAVSNVFSNSNNSLRNFSDDELTLTAEHLKKYVSNAALGSVIRVCAKDSIHVASDYDMGHSALIVQKDENGFTIFEGGVSGVSNYCREKYFTWQEFVNTHYNYYDRQYIKYIQWPGASPVDSRVDVGTGFYGYIINTKQWRHFTNDGSNVSLRTGTGAPNQVWYFERQANGDYLIKSDVDGSYLEVAGNSSAAGANVQTGAYDGDSGQQWCIYGESGAYVFGVRCSNSVLEVKDDSTAEGANIWVNTPWDTSKQYFQIWKLDDYVQPTSVSLNKTSATLTSKGATVSLTATVSPSNATNKAITWSSSNTSVATVNSSGVVTAVSNGTATITVKTTSGAKVATCKVTVAIPTQSSDGWYYTSVLPSNITSSAYEIQYQNIYWKYATTSPGSGWTDTGEDKIEYVKSGSTYTSDWPLSTSETVRLDGYYYYHYCTSSSGTNVDFKYSSTYGHYDELWPSEYLYEYSSTQDYDDSRYTFYYLKWTNGYDGYCWRDSSGGTCSGEYGDHGYRSYYWYKRYIYQNYVATTLNKYQSAGSWSTTKDASASTYKYRYRPLPTGVTLNKTSATLSASGATVALTATVSPSGANPAVTWKSSNTSVATVSSSGVVTAVGNGTATITATTKSGGKTASCTVTVNIIPTGVSLNYTTASYTSSGATLQLVATVSPSNAVNKNVTWKSSNESVAVVDANGLVTTKGNGTATITATTVSGGKTATCTVTVKIAPTGVYMDKTSATLTAVGETLQLIATVTPNNAIDKTVKWDSSNKAVATVNDKGLVTAVGNGTTNITVTTVTGRKTFTCKITVSIKLSGLCKASDGNWYYYVDGKVDTSYTGLAQNKYGWWYINNGELDTTYTGFVLYGNSYWYVLNGGLVTEAMGVTLVNGEWYYLIAGELQDDYTGFASNANGQWYVRNGKAVLDQNGVIRVNGEWYYIIAGQLQQDYTGFASNESGQWYVRNGKAVLTANGVVQVNGDWYYVIAGKLQVGYVGFASNASGQWYIRDGKAILTANGVVQVNGDWYYVIAGQLQVNYTGFASNANGQWYIRNGKAVLTETGVIQVNGEWYYVIAGQLQINYTGFASNANGQWYIRNGKAVLTKTGLIQVNGEWYYVIAGQLQTNYTGLASNEYGIWYIKNGKVDYAYNGTYVHEGIMYTIVNGKVTG